MEIIFLDTERNGSSPHRSVLSVSALKTRLEQGIWEVVELYERFYFSKERLRGKTVELHGLSHDKIAQLRQGVSYPELYQDDKKALRQFCGNTPRLVGHNIGTDLAALGLTLPRRQRFCTQEENRDLVQRRSCQDQRRCSQPRCEDCSSFQSPGLIATATFYGVLAADEQKQLHASSFDAELCRRIFNAMLTGTNESARQRSREFMSHCRGN